MAVGKEEQPNDKPEGYCGGLGFVPIIAPEIALGRGVLYDSGEVDNAGYREASPPVQTSKLTLSRFLRRSRG